MNQSELIIISIGGLIVIAAMIGAPIVFKQASILALIIIFLILFIYLIVMLIIVVCTIYWRLLERSTREESKKK